MKRQAFFCASIMIVAVTLACNFGASARPTATTPPPDLAVPASTPVPTFPPPAPGGGQCGDGIWDAAEQTDPNLCPQDRPISTLQSPTSATAPPQGDLRQHERSFLPQVTAVEKWMEIGIISERQNFAPSIVKLHEGGYRIFWNDALAGGITSASSPDAINFTKDAGRRLVNGTTGDRDCAASHPWLISVDGGYRMYYQGNAICNPQPNQPPTFRIFSALSTDGLNFTKEGVRVDIGETTGLTQAAHGRALRLNDGRYRMWFSANFAGKNAPADVLGATSTDGLTWTLDPAPTLERAHDPTVIQIGDRIYIYTTFLGDNFVILESADGFTFTPTSWVEFYNQRGERLQEFGDADILLTDAGQLLLYGSGKGSVGVGIYLRAP